MTIIHPHHKKRKPKKPSKEELARRAEWDRIVKSHAKPLEMGRKSRGTLPGAKLDLIKIPVGKTVTVRVIDPTLKPPSLPMGSGGTKPAIDPIAIEKRELSGRVGQIYSKGAPQYLSDEDMKEQRSGSHRRR